jgi:hypothetical protein
LKKVPPKPSSKPFGLGYWVKFVQIWCIKYRYTNYKKTVRDLVTSAQRDEKPNYTYNLVFLPASPSVRGRERFSRDLDDPI